MRKILFIACILLNFSLSSLAFTKHVNFNLKDFNIQQIQDEIYIVSSELRNWQYKECASPALPYFNVKYILPYGSIVESSEISYSTPRLIRSNILLNSAPLPAPTSESENFIQQIDTEYIKTIYPSSPGIFSSQNSWRGIIPLAEFTLSPFVYDASNGNLYFIDDFTLSMELTPSEERKETTQSGFSEDVGILKTIVDNPEDVENLVGQIPENIQEGLIHSRYKYVIITSDEMKESFKKLLRWKTIKGYPGLILTPSYIRSRYAAPDLQLAIKYCLYDLYLNYGLEYVVLGGDDSIVPTRGCLGKVRKQTTNSNGKIEYKLVTDSIIPTDKYYACFDGDFKWNANANKAYGEVGDNIDLNENIFVSRIPVRTPSEADAYIYKLLRYENCDNSDTWSESILTCGTKLWTTIVNQSDAEAKGDKLYADFFKYNLSSWKGNRIKFYDTCKNFTSDLTYKLTPQNLNEQISKGHMFLSFSTHGRETLWCTEEEEYSNDSIKGHVAKLKNPQPIHITTCACLTNAFDYEPCLSESFIRDANNGVVSYLGSSRYGWENKDGVISQNVTIGPSLSYEGQFYYRLFDSTEEYQRHYGQLVSAAKSRFSCQEDGSLRWLQYSINPMGDPEMPVYTTIPKKINLNLSIKDGNAMINTDTDNCKITLCSMKDGWPTIKKVISNTSTASFPADECYTICITKNNYKPMVISFNIILGKMVVSMLNTKFDVITSTQISSTEEITIDKNGDLVFVAANDLYVSQLKCVNNPIINEALLSIDSDKTFNNLQIIASNIYGNITILPIIESNSESISVDTSQLNSGIYSLKAVSDSFVIGSCKIIKK